MIILDWLFRDKELKKDKRKRIFISFAIEDIQYRDYLVKQARERKSPFDFIDMSVKKKWNEKEWKNRCRTKIKRSHGFIALLSKNTHKASGARWEIMCANKEGVKMIGMHIKKNNQGATPKELENKEVIIWSWKNLEKFINQL